MPLSKGLHMHQGFPGRRSVTALAAFVLGSCGLLAPAAGQGTLERIKERGSVVIGHREASVPLSYLVDGKPMGYSVDLCLRLAEVLARHAGLKTHTVGYKLLTSANRFDAIEKGEADLECGSTTNTAARRERVAFTIPHFIASSRLIVLSARPYQRIEDLHRKTVASTAGTTNIKSLAQEARFKTLDIEILSAKDHDEGVEWVRSGKVEAFNMDDVLLFGLRANAPVPQAFEVVGKPMSIEPYAIMLPKGDKAFKRVVDAEMRRIIFSGEIHAIYARWFTQPIPPRGINLELPMSYMLKESFRFPSDKVGDLGG